jgi:uncharacterized membrane protein (UPF0127 family)
MPNVTVRNVSRGVLLGEAVDVADTSAKRRTGLLGKDGLAAGEGLWIVPCEGIHTIGMKFPIDVVFLSRKHEVLKVRSRMDKWRISCCLRAHSVLELPAGTVERTGTRKGDQLELAS